MSAGFIVRGVGPFSGRTLYAEPWGDAGETRRAPSARGPRHKSLGEAVRAAIAMHEDCRDVKILAVGEDGSQTPLPSWEEALNAVGILREAVEQALAHHRETKGMTVNPPELHGCPVGALHFLRRTLGRTS